MKSRPTTGRATTALTTARMGMMSVRSAELTTPSALGRVSPARCRPRPPAHRSVPPSEKVTPMAPSHQSSVTVDRLFAPAPHGLINDPQISYPAFRLWCVLHRLSWIKEPPEMDRLCAEMRQQDRTPDRRSVYRWLSELESRGWLRWQRTPGKASVNRFLVLSERAPVTQESQDAEPVIVGSQPVTPESQPVTLRSQEGAIHPRAEPPEKATQNHENHEIDGDDGRTLAFLESEGIGAAQEFAHLPYEPLRRDYQNRRDDGQEKAIIVKAWRRKPPTKDYHYERSRPAQSNGHAPDRRPPSERIKERPELPEGLKLSTWKPDRSE